MPTDLSQKQKILLQIVRDFRRKHGVSPSLGELRKLFGANFTNSIVRMLQQLEEKGYVQRVKGVERGISLVENNQRMVNVRIVGAVACGRPLLAQENTEGYISVERGLLHGDPDNYFFLRAVGDSMNLADINGRTIDDGDFVLVKQQSMPEQGDKVVALIDDEATVKVFKRGPDFVALVPQSSNSENKPIILHSEFTIQGVVKAVYKKEMLTA